MCNVLMKIVEGITSVLEKTPPDIAGDIYDCGITLTGGGALMNGLDRLIQDATGLKVTVAEDPLGCVVRGTSLVLDGPDDYTCILTNAKDYY